MRVIFDKNTICNAVTPIMGAVSVRNTVASAEGILITTNGDDFCTLTSFDLEKGFRIKIPAKVEEAGSYIINGMRFNQIIRALPDGNIEIAVDNKMKVNIRSGKSEFELSAMDGSQFPTLPEFRSEMKFELDQYVFRQMIMRTSFAVAQNGSRAILNGAYFKFESDRFQIVSCDGNRLAIRKQKCEIVQKGEREPNVSFILPEKTLTELLKILKDTEDKVTISITRRNAVFETDGLLFFSRLIDGEYLDYSIFIPSSSKIHVDIDTETIIDSLERASLISEDKTLGQKKNYVKCVFSDGMLQISSVSVNGRVFDEIPTTVGESNIEIGFNCRYLLEALRACGSDTVRCEMNTPLSCMVIKPGEENDEEDFLYLVLPIKMVDSGSR